MSQNSFSSECISSDLTTFPLCLPSQTYGTTLFWAEEYWAVVQIQKLKSQYPDINLSGLIDPCFMQKFPSFFKGPIHEKILGTRSFEDITTFLWEDKRRAINIATSHAPSRLIAENYLHQFGDNFGIITFDAHLDLSNSQKVHGAWITKELASITTVIGGWADTSLDFDNASSHFPFIVQNVADAISSRDLHTWLKGKHIYLSIDLDYYQHSLRNYLGYSNYWHRNKIIGHSMTIGQILEENKQNFDLNSPLLVGKSLGFFPSLEDFIQRKKESLKDQTSEILKNLQNIVKICRKNSATPICIDFVEYSPICDWYQLTINEFVENYSKYRAIIHS
ncbi:MAG: arginase family protein [Promethearchaeota archaeon]